MASLRIKRLPKVKGRTLFIGDVHGCADEMELMLEEFKPGKGDRVILTGDLINGGPDSHRVLKTARKLEAHSVLGNHETRFLHARKHHDPGRLKRRERPTYEALSKKDWKWMNSWPHVIQIPSLDILVVHGGFAPKLKWQNQDPDITTSIQVVDDKGRPCRRTEAPSGAPWADNWKGPLHVIYGHTPRPHPLFHAMATGLDTGCVYGYTLTGISLPDYRIYKIPAGRPYFDE